VVGADGIKSVVRNLIMGPQPFTFWGVRGWYVCHQAGTDLHGE